MRCSSCHDGEMQPGYVEQYDARALFGLEQPVLLVRAPALVCSVCQAVMLEGPVIEAAEQALLRQLVEQAGQLRPSEVRFLRAMLGQSPSQLAERLGTDAATLSRWESGAASVPAAVSWSLRSLVAWRLVQQQPQLAAELSTLLLRVQPPTAPPSYHLEALAS